MSHFSVAVFTDEDTTVEDLLEPYWEGLEVEKYVYKTKKELIEYGKGEIRYFLKVFRRYMKDKKRFRREHKNNINYLRFVKKIPLMKKWDNEKIYKFSIRYYSPEDIGENGEVYSTYNQNSKWDWYEVGGRWKEMLIDKDGNKTNSALIKDIDWNAMKKENEQSLPPYEKYLKSSFYSKEYMKKIYPNEDEYKRKMLKFQTYAALMPDGEWLEPGTMGWWGISSATPEQESKFIDDYEENILKKVDKDWRLTIVDCHI